MRRRAAAGGGRRRQRRRWLRRACVQRRTDSRSPCVPPARIGCGARRGRRPATRMPCPRCWARTGWGSRPRRAPCRWCWRAAARCGRGAPLPPPCACPSPLSPKEATGPACSVHRDRRCSINARDVRMHVCMPAAALAWRSACAAAVGRTPSAHPVQHNKRISYKCWCSKGLVWGQGRGTTLPRGHARRGRRPPTQRAQQAKEGGREHRGATSGGAGGH